jgi:DNA-binding beta-propeller fold protein YncE
MKIEGRMLTYQAIPGWGRVPAGWDLVEVGGLAVDAGDRVYVFNRGPHPVIVLDPEGNFLDAWGEDAFARPHGIRIDANDFVYCTDVGNHTVRKFTTSGKLLQTLGTEWQPSDTGCEGRDYRTIKRAAGPFNAPTSVAFAPGGEICVTDGYGNARVHKYAADGTLLLSWGEPGAGPGQFHLPHGVAIS